MKSRDDGEKSTVRLCGVASVNESLVLRNIVTLVVASSSMLVCLRCRDLLCCCCDFAACVAALCCVVLLFFNERHKKNSVLEKEFCSVCTWV